MAAEFMVVDYVMFTCFLGMSVVIGIYYACTGGRQRTTDEFLMADRNAGVFPVCMSLVASFLSAVSLLGLPNEVYTFGTMFWLSGFSMAITIPVAAHIYLPIYHRLHLTSTYEYLELRFNKLVRICGAVIFTFVMVFYMAVVLYAPALALSSVMGIPLWGSLVATGAVCVFYTTIGGMKAVILTDVFQMTVILSGTLAVTIIGSSKAGGIENVWKFTHEGGRIILDNFDLDPLTRSSFWGMTLGVAMMSTSLYVCNQVLVQRCLCLKTVRRAQASLYGNLVMHIFTTTLLTVCGLVLYARYRNCDPMMSKAISTPDQMVVMFVIEQLRSAPGLAGIFISAVFSASLSTLSSGVNSLATVFLQDFFKPVYLHVKATEMPDNIATTLSKVLAALFGVSVIGLSFLASLLGKNVLIIAIKIFGMIGGPLLGVFTLAVFCPFVNCIGVIAGLFCGLAVCLWIGVGAVVHHPPSAILPLSIAGCANATSGKTLLSATIASINASIPSLMTKRMTPPYDGLEIYKLSYSWYSGLGVITVCVVGIIVSWATGFTNASKVDSKLMFPLYDKIFCCLPRRWKHIINCGVRHSDMDAGLLASDDLMVLGKKDTSAAGANGVKTASTEKLSPSKRKSYGGLYSDYHTLEPRSPVHEPDTSAAVANEAMAYDHVTVDGISLDGAMAQQGSRL